MDERRVGVGVGAVLIREGKVLLGKRSSSEKNGAGTWSLPGGKLEFGETLEEAAKREVMEETGLTVESARVLCVNNDLGNGKHYVTVGLLAGAFSGEARTTAPDELTDWGWFPLDGLPEPLFGPTKGTLYCYIEQRINKY